MEFYKIKWTNGIVVDIEEKVEYEYILSRNDAILSLGYLDEDSDLDLDDYNEDTDLKGSNLLPAFINTYGSFVEDVKKELEVIDNYDLLTLLDSKPDKVSCAIKTVEQTYLSQGIVMTMESLLSKDLIPFIN